MSSTIEVLNALTDLRALARRHRMEVRMCAHRPERLAPLEVEIYVGSRTGGIAASLKPGGDAVDLIRALMHSLVRSLITSPADPPFHQPWCNGKHDPVTSACAAGLGMSAVDLLRRT